jgi:transcriptional regulator with XRE-family HTH domain
MADFPLGALVRPLSISLTADRVSSVSAPIAAKEYPSARRALICDWKLVMPRSVLHTGLRYKSRTAASIPQAVPSPDDNPGMSIGQKIKARRDELGLKAVAVAKKAGLSKQAYSSLENGHQHSTTKLGTICQVLGLSPEWVEFGRGPRLIGTPVGSFVPEAAVQSAPQYKTTPTENEDLGGIARDVVEAALLLTTLTINQRSAVDAVIRTFVATNKAADKHEEPSQLPAAEKNHLTRK